MTGPASTDGEVYAAISTSIVQAFKRYYGKGPTKARTYRNDNYIFCVLEGGLTTSEETLLQAGQEELIRTYRERFEEAVSDELCVRVAALIGHEVVGYHSQIVFEPEPRVFEIFVLGDEIAPATGST